MRTRGWWLVGVLTLVAVSAANSDDPVFRHRVITTPALVMTGKRPDPKPPGPDLSAGFRPRTVNTPALVMTGKRPDPKPPGPDLSARFRPRTVNTPALVMTGKRP